MHGTTENNLQLKLALCIIRSIHNYAFNVVECVHVSVENARGGGRRRRNDFLMKQHGERNRQEEEKIKHKNATKSKT
jgi:hypothetical protein